MAEGKQAPIEKDALDFMERLQEALLHGSSIDTSATLASCALSIAISLKRIADAIEGRPDKLGLVEHIGAVLSDSIYNLKR